MNYRRHQIRARRAGAWAVVLEAVGVRLPVEAPKDITVDPEAVSDPGMKAGRCRFNGVFRNAGLRIYSEKKLPSLI